MSNRLSKVVKPAKNGKQKPVPVRIMYDESQGLAPAKSNSVDKYEVQEALRTLQRAAEIQKNKPLMRAAKTEAQNMMKQLSSVCGVKK